MIKAIIFDADGPLYQRSETVTKLKIELLKKYGYESDYRTFDAAYNKERFKAYDQTETANAMFANIMLQVGTRLSEEQAQTFTEEFNAIQSQVEASPFAIDTLHALHTHGIKICILTDSFYPGNEKWGWFKKLGMDTYIDEIVSSYDIKHLKDTEEAYEACLRLLKVSADQTVFVGHQQYEMNGAKKANIPSIALKTILIPETTKVTTSLQFYQNYLIFSSLLWPSTN